jgi:hypothetical protein
MIQPKSSTLLIHEVLKKSVLFSTTLMKVRDVPLNVVAAVGFEPTPPKRP